MLRPYDNPELRRRLEELDRKGFSKYLRKEYELAAEDEELFQENATEVVSSLTGAKDGNEEVKEYELPGDKRTPSSLLDMPPDPTDFDDERMKESTITKATQIIQESRAEPKTYSMNIDPADAHKIFSLINWVNEVIGSDLKVADAGTGQVVVMKPDAAGVLPIPESEASVNICTETINQECEDSCGKDITEGGF